VRRAPLPATREASTFHAGQLRDVVRDLACTRSRDPVSSTGSARAALLITGKQVKNSSLTGAAATPSSRSWSRRSLCGRGAGVRCGELRGVGGQRDRELGQVTGVLRETAVLARDGGARTHAESPAGGICRHAEAEAGRP
jgi:hypothetical protein